jgi:hypothetical protein
MRDKIDKVLLLLLDKQIVRCGKSSWRWAEKFPARPSLNNDTTSQMFRSNLVEEVDGEMKLSSTGRMLANRIQSTK